jgi:hypothetical protein
LWYFRFPLLFQFNPEIILSFAWNPFQSILLKTQLFFGLRERKATFLRFYSLQRFGFEQGLNVQNLPHFERLTLYGLITILTFCQVQNLNALFQTSTLLRFAL